MTESRKLNSIERSIWTKFVHDLNRLNAIQYSIIRGLDRLQNTNVFIQQNNVNIVLDKSLIARSRLLNNKIVPLNNAQSLIQSGAAFVQNSQKFKNDLDIAIKEKTLSPSMIKNATFRRSQVIDESGLGVVPILMPLVVVGISVIVYGIVNAITETIREANQLNRDIQSEQKTTELELSKNPSIFKTWTKYKSKILGTDKGGLVSTVFGEDMGGMIGIGLALVVGYFLFKMVKK